jgi:hypothetical protein
VDALGSKGAVTSALGGIQDPLRVNSANEREMSTLFDHGHQAEAEALLTAVRVCRRPRHQPSSEISGSTSFANRISDSCQPI